MELDKDLWSEDGNLRRTAVRGFGLWWSARSLDSDSLGGLGVARIIVASVGSGGGTAPTHSLELVAELLLVDELALAGLQLFHAAVLQVADGAGHQAVDDVDLGAGQARGLRVATGQLALVLEEQVAHARTSSASVVALLLLLAFHCREECVRFVDGCRDLFDFGKSATPRAVLAVTAWQLEL